MLEFDRLFQTIEELVMLHSPSGVESEINDRLMEKFAALGVNAWIDRADNAIVLIKGRNPERSIAITAHKDEIGAIVKTIGVWWICWATSKQLAAFSASGVATFPTNPPKKLSRKALR